MSELQSWGVLGYRDDGAGNRNIGGEVVNQIGARHESLGLESAPRFILTTAGVLGPDGITPLGVDAVEDLDPYPDVVFNALPSTQTGEVAHRLVQLSLERGADVVGAEKSSLAVAEFYAESRDASGDFSSYGINATVGGGLMPLEICQPHLRDPSLVRQIHLSVNGTMTFLMSETGPLGVGGDSIGLATQGARLWGFAEPGAVDPYEVIRGEATGDIPRKIAIFLNKMGLAGDELADWREFTFELSDDEIAQALDEAKVRRFIVSIYPKDPPFKHSARPEKDIIGGSDVTHGDWRVVSGFRMTDRNGLINRLATLTGSGNGVALALGPDEEYGTPVFTGQGAGRGPTVGTMMLDRLKLRGK